MIKKIIIVASIMMTLMIAVGTTASATGDYDWGALYCKYLDKKIGYLEGKFDKHCVEDCVVTITQVGDPGSEGIITEVTNPTTGQTIRGANTCAGYSESLYRLRLTQTLESLGCPETSQEQIDAYVDEANAICNPL